MIISRVSALLGAATAAALLAVVSSTGYAADLGYSIKDVPPPAPSGRTWYLKGTIGAGNSEVGSMWNEAYASGDYTVGHKDMKSSPLYGVGVGLEYNRWLRFDVTGEYRGKYLFIGNDRYNNGGPCPGTGCGTNSFTADIELGRPRQRLHRSRHLARGRRLCRRRHRYRFDLGARARGRQHAAKRLGITAPITPRPTSPGSSLCGVSYDVTSQFTAGSRLSLPRYG